MDIFNSRYKSMVGVVLLLVFSTCFLWAPTNIITTPLVNFLDIDENGYKIYLGEKVKNIAYLKVPKTGSSTLSCIFMRYGIRNNLSVFLYQEPFINKSHQILLVQQGRQFDIFATHTLYSYKFFTYIVRNPAIIGSVREPAERLVSHVFYTQKFRDFQRKSGLSSQNFIDKIVSNTSKYNLHCIMTTYFGIRNHSIEKTHLMEILHELDAEFLLVIVLEKLHESLIILKRLLHWSFVDILYAKKRTNPHEKVVLSSRQRAHLRLTNNVEYEIYNYFLKELNRKIANAGNDFAGEVRLFEEILNETNVYCIEKKYVQEPTHRFPSSRWDKSFSISFEECNLIFKTDVNGFRAMRQSV